MNNKEYICGMAECIINAGDVECGMNINGFDCIFPYNYRTLSNNKKRRI